MATDYYSHTVYPAPGSTATSQGMRSELDAVEAGFAKLIPLSTNAGKFVRVNEGGTAQVASTFLTETSIGVTIGGSALTGSGVTAMLASPAPIGGVSPNSAVFTTLRVTQSIDSVNSLGMVVSQSGGFQFPDGTVQASAAGSTAFTSYQALAVLAAIAY